nr:uncharacterized protein LOC117843028 [Setaria viridis]
MDELVGEILLRLPPDEPEHLFRAALVCKPWLRVLCDPAFRSSYRAFHRAPPLLGLLHRLMQRLPQPGIPWLIYTAAVICAADGCDHLDCHGGPFRVVFVATHDYKNAVMASVYSSETGVWSTLVTLDDGCEVYAQHMRDALADIPYIYTPYVQPRRCTLIGDEVYFTIRRGNAIIKYNWASNCLSMINPPSHNVYRIALMVMEGSTLGFACIESSNLHLWSRKVNSEGAAEWVQLKAIKLETVIPIANSDDDPFVAGFAEGVDVIFICSDVGLFTMDLKSGQVKKVAEHGVYFSVLPYMSFYTPDHGTLLSVITSKG